MDQVAPERADFALYARRLMHFARAAPAAAAAVEQAQDAVRIGVAVAQELAEILDQPGETVTGRGGGAARALRLDRRTQLRADAFVGVQAQDPVVGGLFDRELFLAAETVERPRNHACTQRLGDRARGIGRMRVDHHDLVAERERGEAVANAVGLVERDNARGNRHARRTGLGSSDGGLPVVRDRALCAAHPAAAGGYAASLGARRAR